MPEISVARWRAIHDLAERILAALDTPPEPPMPLPEVVARHCDRQQLERMLQIVAFAYENRRGWKPGLVGIYLLERYAATGLTPKQLGERTGIDDRAVAKAWHERRRVTRQEGPRTDAEIYEEARAHLCQLVRDVWSDAEELLR